MENKKRLIDANLLSDAVAESQHNNPHPQGMIRVNHRNEHNHFLRMIMDAPTVDAVEVVRCKDCKHYEEDFCWRWGGVRDLEHFCSYGERREGE